MVRPALVIAALLAATLAFAGDNPPDPHLASNRIAAVVRESAFFHGYLHGYEQGFHLGDLDVQMARGTRDISKCKEAKDGAGYRDEFGDKHFFEIGYRQGVRVGYADAVGGRAFRALREVDAIGAIAPTTAERGGAETFDEGFSQGYAMGQHQGLEDGRNRVSYTAALPACPVNTTHTVDRQSFCAAYIGGYRFGYSDGVVNVSRPPALQYEARAGK